MAGFTFETLGGSQEVDLFEGPSGDSPIVIVAPAIGIEARYYSSLCAGLAAKGIGAVAVDMPGHGSSQIRAGRRNDWGYGELVDHYASAVRAFTEAMPNAGLYLLGHSLGGHVSLMVAAQADLQVLGVVLIATGVPYWRAWSGPSAIYLRLGSAFFGAVARVLGYFPGSRFGFGGREARTLILQWAQSARTGMYDLRGFGGEALLARPGPPVHSIGLRGDFFAPEAAIRHLLNKLSPRRRVTHEVWESAPEGGDHNRWPTDPGFVVERVVSFVNQAGGSS